MAIGQSAAVRQAVHSLWSAGVCAGLTDSQLLDRFSSAPAEEAGAAFDALMQRHGPMVLRVCRDILADPNDADDAFQATFLVLVRCTASIRDRDSLASWLYGAARRVALRARADMARRREIESRGARLASSAARDLEPFPDGSALLEEVDRLPVNYRAPIVLCYLEGSTHEGAARQLGWQVGTVRGRLARARELLKTRLIRRGVTASAALAVLEGSQGSARAAVPAALRDSMVHSAVRIASGKTISAVASARITSWTESASTLIGRSRWWQGAGLLISIGAAGIGLGLVMAGAPPLQQPPQPQPATSPESHQDRSANLREMLRLKGTWTSPQTVTWNVGGKPQPPKAYKLIYSIDRDTITTTDDDGFASRTYRFAVDPNQTPKRIDLTELNTGLELRGIYKLEGETLTICEGLDRPKEFREGPAQIPIVFHRENRTPMKLAPEYPNAEGCYWAVVPKGAPPSSLATSGGISAIIKKDQQGALVVTLATVCRLVDGEPEREYRPVAFDDEKTRYLLEPGEGGWASTAPFRDVALAHNEYRLDPGRLPFDRVKRLGIEVVPAEVRRAAKKIPPGQAKKPS